MNRIRTSLLLLLALGLSIVSTAACADDDDDSQNDPPSQTSEISEIDKSAAVAQPTPNTVSTVGVIDHPGLVQGCDTCGPLPDPWAKGPLPDPWTQSSSSGTSTPGGGTDTSGHK